MKYIKSFRVLYASPSSSSGGLEGLGGLVPLLIPISPSHLNFCSIYLEFWDPNEKGEIFMIKLYL